MVSLSLPGIIDAHVHLRDPGATHKEDAYSGTVAALAGGVIGVLDMPNNTPPTVDRRTFLQKRGIFGSKAVSDYGPFLGFDGEQALGLLELVSQSLELKLRQMGFWASHHWGCRVSPRVMPPLGLVVADEKHRAKPHVQHIQTDEIISAPSP